MEKVINKINNYLREIEVTATEEEVKPLYDKLFKEYATKLNIPGFRKGKVPATMISKMYGNMIDKDFKEEVINEFTKQVAKENNIRPISQAEVIKEEYKKGETFYFKVQFEVSPEVELKQYKDIEFELPVFPVLESDVENSFQRLLESRRELVEDNEALDEKHLITVDVQITDRSGVPIIGQRNENVQVALDDTAVPEDIRNALLNCSVGDEIMVAHKGSTENQSDDLNAIFSVKKIQKILYPEINESFIKKVTGDKYSTLEELKSLLKSNLEAEYVSLSENILMGQLDNELILRNNFEIPEGMIENYLETMIENHKEKQPNKTLPRNFNADEFRETNRAYAINKIKSYLLHSKIIETEDIKVDEIDYSILADTESLKTGISKERLMNYYKSSEEVKDRLIQNKLFLFLKENNKITEKIQDRTKNENKIITE